MNVTSLTGPTSALLDLQEVKEWLKVEGDNTDDVLIQGLIDATQRRYEGPGGILGRTFARQTWTGRLDAWPCSGRAVEIPLPPLVSVDEVRYVASDGTLTTWDSSEYQAQRFSERPGKLWPAYGSSWPAVRSQPDAIEVDFTAGYAPQDLPANARMGFLQAIAHWYDNRAATADRQAFDVPMTADEILAPLKIWYL